MSIAAHYARQNLTSAVLGALANAGKNPEHLTDADLAPIDEFHVRGRRATVDLAAELAPDKAMQVLDAGCGLGGAARYLARQFGCRVTGLDLSEDYCRTAAELTRRLGLDSLVSFQQGSALALPFPDSSFQIVWTQHTAMNIEDKTGFYRELRRVLQPGGRLALYDILAGAGGEVRYPVPWARVPDDSFLVDQEQLRRTLATEGFEILSWRDVTEAGRTWFRKVGVAREGEPQPPLGLHLLMEDDYRLMMANQLRNLEENRISLLEAVVRRPA